MKKYQFANLLLPVAFGRNLTYFVPEAMDLKIGDVVKAPLRGRNFWGVVVGLTNHSNLDTKLIKSIIERDSNIVFTSQLIDFINWVADYNLAHPGAVLKLAISILNSSKQPKIPKKSKSNNHAVSKVEVNEQFIFNLKNLSAEQKKAAEFLSTKIAASSNPVILLDGVTGSGKTEVYFTAIAKILEDTKNDQGQVLILLPEIVLTSQLVERFTDQFGVAPKLWHSKITNSKKRQIFYGLASGSIRVLIGTRSALFLPFKNLCLIVIDEEHDPSFKQEDAVNYNGRDMAIVRAKIEKIPVILSSATPSIETYSNAKTGKYQQIDLPSRFAKLEETAVRLVDMRKENLSNNHHISALLKQELASNLSSGRQSMLFLNRRGYAPLTLCKVCGYKINCYDCSAYLTYHQKSKKLVCHQCGYNAKIPDLCPNCKEQGSMIVCGAGVEKIKEEILQYFPNARIALITSDTVTNIDLAWKIIKPILDNEIDIIIGTQIIAKGHHFPSLSLVGIIDGDSSFYNANLRTAERSYQLLTQVIGRAGREKYQGQVILQTYNPENLIFKNIINGSRNQFLETELKNRELMKMPPFSRMAAIIFSSAREDLAIRAAKELLREFCQISAIEVFGPAPMPVSKIRNRYYYRLTIRSLKKINLQKIISAILAKANISDMVRIKVDIDPNN